MTQQLNEGPSDFMRGAFGELRNKTAAASQRMRQQISKTGGDIYQAGKQASSRAEVEKLIFSIAKMISPSAVPTDAERIEPSMEEPAVKQSTQPTVPSPSKANASMTVDQSPKYGGPSQPYNYRYMQFGEFLSHTYSGEKLDEGMWDFIKGAGKEVGKKINDKLSAYAERPSVLRDIYQAGKKTSQVADQRRSNEQARQAEMQQRVQLSRMMNQLVNLVGQMPQQARNDVLYLTIRKLPPALQQPTWNRIREALSANGVQVGSAQ